MLNLGKRWKFIPVFLFAFYISSSEFAAAEPLHEAVKEGDLVKVKSFIAEGFDVNTLDENGLTPLHLAAYRGNNELAELLILKWRKYKCS